MDEQSLFIQNLIDERKSCQVNDEGIVEFRDSKYRISRGSYQEKMLGKAWVDVPFHRVPDVVRRELTNHATTEACVA